jgi:hypothetical protein
MRHTLWPIWRVGISSNYQTGKRFVYWPQSLNSMRHCASSFACSEYQGAALGRSWQKGLRVVQRHSAARGSIEQLPQKSFRVCPYIF